MTPTEPRRSPIFWMVEQLYQVGEPAYGADGADPAKPRPASVHALPRRRREFDWRQAARKDDNET